MILGTFKNLEDKEPQINADERRFIASATGTPQDRAQ